MYDSILVAIDGSDPAETASRQAVALAGAFDASLLGVTAVEKHALSLSGESDEPVRPDEETQQAIEAFESLAAESGVPCRTTVQRGAAHSVIDAVAVDQGTDLVGMGTHGRRGLDHALLGSVAERTLRTSQRPILATPALDQVGFDSILVPTDGSDCAGRAVEHALAIAAAVDASLHVVSVVDLPTMSLSEAGVVMSGAIEDMEADHERYTETVAERARAHDLQVTTATRTGTPARALRKYAVEEDLDLITMGTHGRSGLDRYLLGSTTERLLRTVERPVLAVPPES